MITPRISPDGKTNYFSAKLDDSFGGFDIYKANITNKSTLSNLQNLGAKVNSTFDEISPNEFEDYIYFASNDTKGFGGFDLYRVLKNDNTNTKFNLGNKINTGREEINIVPTSKTQGYFTSNKGETFLDVLRYTITEKNIKLETLCKDDSNSPIKKLFVEVRDNENKLFFSGLTNDDGIIQINTKENTSLI